MSRMTWFLLSMCVIAVIVIPGTIALFVRPKATPGSKVSLWVDLWDAKAQTVRKMPAEMPASFGLEALKAQAVAARTYALRKMLQNQENSASRDAHRGAVICSDPSHCNAWNSREELLIKWGVEGYLGNIR